MISDLQFEFTASLNAYFAHRELEIPPSKRKSYKNLQDAANIQWHRYIKKTNNICYSAKSNTEKYKKLDALCAIALRPRFCLYRFDLCPFSADFVVCDDIWSRNMVNPT